jgi:hypothetical protein
MFCQSFFICCYKVYDFLQTLIRAWLKDSFNQLELQRPKELVLLQETKALIFPPKFLELVPCTPKHPHSHKLAFDNLGYLILLTNAFVTKHIFTKFSMDSSMMLCLHQVS